MNLNFPKLDKNYDSPTCSPDLFFETFVYFAGYIPVITWNDVVGNDDLKYAHLDKTYLSCIILKLQMI